jgi:probable HAF family extracellular repeat protein
MLRLAERIVSAALLAASFTAAAALPSNWSIADLDGLPGEPKGMSDSGFVVGCQSVGTTNRAFIWSNGVSRELSPELPAGSNSCAYAVNNGGMVAGVVDGQVVVWSEAGLSRLPISGVPHGINAAGVVVGAITFSADPRTPTHAFMWRQGVVTDLHPAAAQASAAFAINNSGQVAGTVDSTAVIWENGGMRTIGSGFITVGAMNDFGEVVGLYIFGNANKAQPYVFSGNTLSPIPGGANGELSVLAITNGGRVLVNGVDSYTTVLENGQRLSFESSPSIRAAGWKRLEPRAMNNRGWIVGYGTHDGPTRKFLITPLDIAAGVNPLARPSVRSAPLIRAAGRG